MHFCKSPRRKIARRCIFCAGVPAYARIRLVLFGQNDRRNANKSRVNSLSIRSCLRLALVSHTSRVKIRRAIDLTYAEKTSKKRSDQLVGKSGAVTPQFSANLHQNADKYLHSVGL